MEQKSASFGTSSNNSTAKNSWNLFLVFASLGWIIALISLWHRQKINNLALETTSFCNISEAINCDTVALSKYSAFFGIPTASWGMLYYAMLIFIGVWSYFKLSDGHEDEARGGATWALVLSGIALIPTVALAYISYFWVGSLCLFCMGNYLCNLLIAAMAYKVYRSHKMDKPMADLLMAPLGKLGQAGWIIVVIIVGLHLFSHVFVGRMATGGGEADDRLVDYSVQSYQVQQQKTFNTQGYASFGPENAPVTVVEFSDFQCPHCARSAVTVPPLLKGYGDKVHYVYKFYPIDSACNPAIQHAAHPLACAAAKAGLCVLNKKGSPEFFEYKKHIFDHQPELSIDLIKQIAEDRGVQAAELDTCMSDPKIHQKVVDSINEGTANGVEGTPTIFVNGRRIEMGPHPKALRSVIDYALSQAAVK